VQNCLTVIWQIYKCPSMAFCNVETGGRATMGLHARFIASLSRNPVAWSLLAAFALAEYGNWQRGRELSRVCALVRHEATYASRPRTARQEIDKICAGREPVDAFETPY